MSAPVQPRFSLKRLLPIGVVLALAAGGGAYFRFGASKIEAATKEQQARVVLVEPVALVARAQSRTLVGTVRARIEADHAFRIAGKIAVRHVQAGDRVIAGQALASLDAADLTLQRELAEAELGAAKASEAQATAELSRITQLRARGWSTEQALDRQKAAQEEAIGRRVRAERSLAIAVNALSYAKLSAETSGIVISISAEPGQVVAAGFPIARIARDGGREIQVFIPEQDLVFARDAKADAVLWSGGQTPMVAELRELSPNADPATRTFLARYALSALAADAPLGMTATLHLEKGETGSQVRLPLSSLVEDGQGPEVYVVRSDKTLERRKVVVVARNAREAFITGDLKAGEDVVVMGVHKLKPGEIVRTQRAAIQG